jgi:hypothetical protein
MKKHEITPIIMKRTNLILQSVTNGNKNNYSIRSGNSIKHYDTVTKLYLTLL